PPTKLQPIGTALQWATNIGHPGPANPAESEVFDTFVLPTMFANAATGRMTPAQALDDAHKQVKTIFEKWRAKGLVAGGSKDKAWKAGSGVWGLVSGNSLTPDTRHPTPFLHPRPHLLRPPDADLSRFRHQEH